MAISDDYIYLKEQKPEFIKLNRYFLETSENLDVLKIIKESLDIEVIATSIDNDKDLDFINKRNNFVQHTLYEVIRDGNLVITDNPDGTWKVLINDYQNDNLPKFIPPYNSDADYTFDISAYSYDNPDSSIAQTLQIDVTVDAVADVPVNDDLNNNTVT